MTVAEFDQLPESPSCSYELRHGELVKVTRPVLKHVFVQKRLMALLDSEGGSGSALMEVGFRPCQSTNFASPMWPTHPKSAGRSKIPLDTSAGYPRS